MEKHKIDLRFCIWGFEDISHDRLTKLIEVEPIKEYFKGQPVNRRVPNGKIAKENGWIIRPGDYQEDDDFETQINKFLDLAESKIEIFTEVCGKYQCEFSCVVNLDRESEENTPWIHLGDRYNNLFGKMNVHFDLSLCF